MSILKKSLLITLSAIILGIGIYGGFTYLGSQQMTKGILGYIGIRVDPAYASLPVQYSWVNAIPVQTDDTNFEWINGRPYIYMNITSTATLAITNDPATKGFGIVDVSSTYYAKGSAPSNPVVDGDCTFTITETGGSICDIDIHGHNATGGVGWTLGTGAPGADAYRLTVYKTGDNPASGVVLTTADQELKDSLAASGTIKWDFKLETGSSFTDGVQKTFIITVTARAHT